MTLRLLIEHSVHPQQQREMIHHGGEFSIGRGAECSWQLDDPDMYVSRKHCVITGESHRFIVTDASRGGVFIDGKDTPLGPGNSALLEEGMRLRLGDIVIRVRIEQPAAAPAHRPAAPAPTRIDTDDFFSRPITPPPPVHRPEALPQPFETGAIDARRSSHTPDRPAPPPMFDDPFVLDQTTPGRPPGGVPGPIPSRTDDGSDDFSFGSFFDEPAQPQSPAAPADDKLGLKPADPTSTAASQAPVGHTVSQAGLPDPTPAGTDRLPSPEVLIVTDQSRVRVMPSPSDGLRPPATPDASMAAPPGPPVAASNDTPDDPYTETALRNAFYRGLGLDPSTLPASGSPEEMEALGKRFRLLVEGLMVMMRTRAREKQNARVAQTLIGSNDVNPLKFLASTNDVMAALISPRGAGYLGPDDAINGAFRDLADHQMRSWVAMQTALRKMIDRFDPTAIERELFETGMLQGLLSGGRNANLWRLYNERYQEIARSAEDRFLGEVGTSFRDAYEGNREKIDDK